MVKAEKTAVTDARTVERIGGETFNVKKLKEANDVLRYTAMYGSDKDLSEAIELVLAERDALRKALAILG